MSEGGSKVVVQACEFLYPLSNAEGLAQQASGSYIEQQYDTWHE
jgi:hypothetical protein